MTDGQLLTAQIRIGDDGVRREVGDELILLDLDSEAYYGLNPTARAFVEGVCGGGTPAEVAAAIAAEHGEGVEGVRDDMMQLLRELLDAGLVDIVPS